MARSRATAARAAAAAVAAVAVTVAVVVVVVGWEAFFHAGRTLSTHQRAQASRLTPPAVSTLHSVTAASAGTAGRKRRDGGAPARYLWPSGAGTLGC